MEFQTTEHKRCTVIKTSGRVDGSTAPELEKALKEITDKGVYHIVFDMADVTFVSSRGWWALIGTQKVCKPRGELVLVSVEKLIRESLNLVGMDTYFKIYDDVTTAVGSF